MSQTFPVIKPGAAVTLWNAGGYNAAAAVIAKWEKVTALPPLYLVKSRGRWVWIYSPTGAPDDIPPTGTVGNGVDGFFNTAQSYTATCPAGTNGTPVTATVAAGTIGSTVDQATADALALELATDRALLALSCATTVAVSADARIRCVAATAVGNIILIGGDFGYVNGIERPQMAALKHSFALSPECWKFTGGGYINSISFNPATPGSLGFAAGTFTGADGVTSTKVAHLASSGQTLSPYDAGTIVCFTSEYVNVLYDTLFSRALLYGNILTVSGTARNGMARVLGNNTVDSGFNPPAEGGVHKSVRAVIIQGAKYYVAGFYTVLGNNPGVVRMNSNGTIDTTFNPAATSSGLVNAIVYNAFYIYCGSTATWGGSGPCGLIKLLDTGARDATFQTNAGTGVTLFGNPGTVNALAMHLGKLLLAGSFTEYNGSNSISNIARINLDGTFDSTFTGATFNGAITQILVDTGNSIICVGTFTAVNGVTRGNICKLSPTGDLLG